MAEQILILPLKPPQKPKEKIMDFMAKLHFIHPKQKKETNNEIIFAFDNLKQVIKIRRAKKRILKATLRHEKQKNKIEHAKQMIYIEEILLKQLEYTYTDFWSRIYNPKTEHTQSPLTSTSPQPTQDNKP